MENKRVLLGAEYSILEPLALYYLSSVARQEGWEPRIILSKGPDYRELNEQVIEFQPALLGVTLFTGNHIDLSKQFKRLKKETKELQVIVGGPHPTYFPQDALEYADFVVVGEGFSGFRRILRGEVKPGIVHLIRKEPFPPADREDFFKRNPAHRENRIKNIVTGGGCIFSCSHCYNSNLIRDVEGFSPKQISDMERALRSERFFPLSQRPVKEVIKEVEDIQKISPTTSMFFIEDDIFGINLNWLEEFTREYKARVPFHANMRFELIDPKKSSGRRRLELIKRAGCTGLSLAIESGDPTIRKEVLNRETSEEVIFRVLRTLHEYSLKARTYQMLGLPYGATSVKTKINLEADLQTLELNVRLKEETGLPTFAWASTLAPYPGTKIADYCLKYGFHGQDFGDIIGAETYRIRSVLRHARKWVGPTLSSESDEWLPVNEQEAYKEDLNLLMDYFPIFASFPKGHRFAREFLKRVNRSPESLIEETERLKHLSRGEELAKLYLRQEDRTAEKLNKLTRNHVYDNFLYV